MEYFCCFSFIRTEKKDNTLKNFLTTNIKYFSSHNIRQLVNSWNDQNHTNQSNYGYNNALFTPTDPTQWTKCFSSWKAPELVQTSTIRLREIWWLKIKNIREISWNFIHWSVSVVSIPWYRFWEIRLFLFFSIRMVDGEATFENMRSTEFENFKRGSFMR